MSFWHEVVVPVVSTVLVMLAISTPILLGVNWMISISCRTTAQEMKRQHQWSFWTGCMIKNTKGEWIPLEAYRDMN